MSKTVRRTACFYLPHEDVKRLDEIGGGIFSRSQLGAIAVKRLIADIETGKLTLMSTTTPTELNSSSENDNETNNKDGVKGMGQNYQEQATTFNNTSTFSFVNVPSTKIGVLTDEG